MKAAGAAQAIRLSEPKSFAGPSVQSGKKSKKANRLWRIDPSKLKPGDVLLERAPTAKSLAIRAATRGEYSHALIWMGNSDFMESVGDGVQPMPYARIVTADPSRWTLLRLNSNRRAATAAATHVRSHSFKNSKITISEERSPLFSPRPAPRDRQHCFALNSSPSPINQRESIYARGKSLPPSRPPTCKTTPSWKQLQPHGPGRTTWVRPI
jgi:hypothetical protein